MELLDDQTLQFIILALIAFITILVSVLIYLKQRQKKSLSYELLSDNSLLTVEEQIKKDIEIFYKGKSVELVRLITLRIENTGNTPIRTDDYSETISIDFGEKTQFLSVEIIDKKPNNLKPSFKIQKQKIELEPILLNPEDQITIKILGTKMEKELNIESRIAGVNNIKKVTKGIALPLIFLLSAWGIIIGGFILLIQSLYGETTFLEAMGQFGIIMLIGFTVGVVGMFMDKRWRKIIIKMFKELSV